MDDLREKACRDICAAHAAMKAPFDKAERIYIEANWQRYGKEVDITLAAIHASGHRIVPVEPTEEMLREGATKVREFMDVRGPYPRTHAMYRAMLTAYSMRIGCQMDGDGS